MEEIKRRGMKTREERDVNGMEKEIMPSLGKNAGIHHCKDETAEVN